MEVEKIQHRDGTPRRGTRGACDISAVATGAGIAWDSRGGTGWDLSSFSTQTSLGSVTPAVMLTHSSPSPTCQSCEVPRCCRDKTELWRCSRSSSAP